MPRNAMFCKAYWLFLFLWLQTGILQIMAEFSKIRLPVSSKTKIPTTKDLGQLIPDSVYRASCADTFPRLPCESVLHVKAAPCHILKNQN